MENRKDKRFGERDTVLIRDIFQPVEDSANNVINAYTHDISVSGARICSDQDFPIGYIIRIVIDLKRTHQSLNVGGEVIWTQKSIDGKHFDVGVEFVHNISDTILMLIKHLYGKQVGIPSSIY